MAKNDFDFPSNNYLVDDDKYITLSWSQWAQRIHTIASSLQQSGPTSERPTKLLWVGRRYFDTTLGYPIWLKSIDPTVWINAEGRVAGTPLSTNGPLFRASSSGTQALPSNAETKILFATEFYDTNGNYANSRFTPTVPGYYQFNWLIDVSFTINTLQFLYSLIRLSGGSATGFGGLVGGGNTAGLNRFSTGGSEILAFNGTTDFVEIIALYNATSPTVQQAWFSGHFIRPL